MTTWISKALVPSGWPSRPLAALAVVAALGGCADGVDPAALLAGLTPPEDVVAPGIPLTQAMMMRGKVTLVPPGGYCIDPDSLTQSFALMGRCDVMGVATESTGAPAGVMTVSIARSSKSAPLPNPAEISTASGLGSAQDARTGDASIVFKTTGPPPSADMSPTHWRGIAKLNRFTIGAALYGPEGHRAVSAEGASLIEDMLKRTTAKTNAS